MYDNREVVTDAEAEMEREQTADNMSEDDAPETDKSAETAGAQSAGDGALSDVERQWQDKYLRLVAEFDNYRKRTLREKMDLVETGGKEVLKAMLPVRDDVERALAAMDKSDDIEALREGVRLIAQKFTETLRQRGVTQMEAAGEPFDPDRQEAVAKFAAGEEKRGLVIDVVQTGYMLGDKVLRFAKVVVGE
ncbi:MAG TPA: nucleotide exchange factor GrpE [Alistipes sp.]|nr:nucleotide exchange factor GrpE [Alistipes sp.]